MTSSGSTRPRARPSRILARRAHHLGIGVIAVWSLRGAAPDEWPGVPSLPLADLAYADAVALARSAGLAAPVAEALVGAVGGNPLALVEAPAQLTAAQRAGARSCPIRSRPANDSSARTPLGSPPCRRRPATACCSRPPARRRRWWPASCAPPRTRGSSGSGSGPPRMARARRTGVAFSHPLARAAVYHAAAPSARRDAHERSLRRSASPSARGSSPSARAAPDEDLAARLEELGEQARRRGAPGTAAAVLERAMRLTPDPAVATRRALAAAAAAAVAGQPSGRAGVLDAVLPTVEDPRLRADVQLLRGMAIHQSGHPREACALLEAEAEAIAAEDPAARPRC